MSCHIPTFSTYRPRTTETVDSMNTLYNQQPYTDDLDGVEIEEDKLAAHRELESRVDQVQSRICFSSLSASSTSHRSSEFCSQIHRLYTPIASRPISLPLPQPSPLSVTTQATALPSPEPMLVNEDEAEVDDDVVEEDDEMIDIGEPVPVDNARTNLPVFVKSIPDDKDNEKYGDLAHSQKKQRL